MRTLVEFKMHLVPFAIADKNLNEYPDPAGRVGLSGRLYPSSMCRHDAWQISTRQEAGNCISAILTLTSVAITPSSGNRPGIGWNNEWLWWASCMLINGGSPCSCFHEIRLGPIKRRQNAGQTSIIWQRQNFPEVVQLLLAVGWVICIPMACPTRAKKRDTGCKYIVVTGQGRTRAIMVRSVTAGSY